MCRWIGSPVALPSTRSSRCSSFGSHCNDHFGRRSAGEAGFTLIEVLVAFAVLAIVLIPLLQVFGDGLGTTQTARAYARAALLARSKLDEIGVDAPLVEGEETGNFDDPGFRWRSLVMRDTSEVIAPPPPAGSRERRRSRLSEGTDASGRSSQSHRSFGQNRTGSIAGGNESFARGGTGFGASRSSLSNSGSSFGDSSSSSFGRGTGSSLSSRDSSGADGGALNSDEQLTDESALMVYRVIVTVEWGGGTGNSLTLSTVRARRPPEEADDRNRGNDSGTGNGTGSSRDRTSSFGRDRSGASGSGFGSRTGSGFGSRSGSDR